MPAPRKNPTIILVDAMPFRRAGMVSLLEGWADSGGLQLISLTPDEAPNQLDLESDCRMLILNVGGDSLLTRALRHVKVLRALAPNIPLVVVSDSAHPDEVAAALSAGAQGFIPTDITPELATQTFSFVLSGGSYFPPSAVRQLQSRSEQARESPAPRLTNDHGNAGSSRKRHFSGGNGANGPLDASGSQPSALPREYLCPSEPDPRVSRRLGLSQELAPSFPNVPAALLFSRENQESAALPRAARDFFSRSIPVEVAITAFSDDNGIYQLIESRPEATQHPDMITTCADDFCAHQANGSEPNLIRGPMSELTPREKDVLAALELGLPNKLIAARLNLSENTVKMHVQRIMRKCSAKNRTEAVLLCSGRLSSHNGRTRSRVS